LGGDPYGEEYGEENAAWNLEIAYVQLLTLAEAQELPHLRADIARDLDAARAEGLSTGENSCGEPGLKWAGPASRYVTALRAIYVNEPSHMVTRHIESILREAIYPLNDPDLFDAPPRDEATVHRRLEGILRCVFPDPLRKPRLTKPIKHFEPDTGIPSIQTLIEYKYLSSSDQAASIVDEILADTRGYASKEWTSFIYVIYESARIRPEAEWRQLLRACDIASRTTVVVLTGEGTRESRCSKRSPNMALRSTSGARPKSKAKQGSRTARAAERKEKP